MPDEKPKRIWVPDAVAPGVPGWIDEREANAENLRGADDYRWAAQRPDETINQISRATSPQISVDASLRDLEKAVVKDKWIGPHQRGQLLRELRWFAAFHESRQRTGGRQDG